MAGRNRNFVNAYSEYNNQELLQTRTTTLLKQSIEDQLRANAFQLLKTLEKEYKPNLKDFTVYTGTAGIALMYFHLFTKLQDDTKKKEYLSKAVDYISWSLKHMNSRDITFLCGAAGPLAIAAVIYQKSGNSKESQQCLNNLLSLNKSSVYSSSMPDELLYGRSGYLYSLLFVQHHLGLVIEKDVLEKVAEAIIESGHKYSQAHHISAPLMYEWYDTMYLGAAHGLTGIIFTLLIMKDSEAVQSRLNSHIRKTVDYLLTLKFPSGNYPAAIEPHATDELVHWCHGAPGWIFMFLSAHKTFNDVRYLQAAEECADVVWRRGLLKKGYGLCHGVAGNAYCFAAIYRETDNLKYLYQALKFSEWIFDYGKHGCRIADTPYSLFEGMAGTIYFLFDMLNPSEAKFPAFEL